MIIFILLGNFVGLSSVGSQQMEMTVSFSWFQDLQMSSLWIHLSLAVDNGAILDIDNDSKNHIDKGFNYLCSFLDFLLEMRTGDSFLIGRFE